MATPTPGQPTPRAPVVPISIRRFWITGIEVDVHGLTELDPSCRFVNVLWLLHGKDLDRTWMHPMAAQTVVAWNERRERLKQRDEMQRRDSLGKSQSPDMKLPIPGLLVASIDHRNHGSRRVHQEHLGDWDGRSPYAAVDLFGIYQGTATDVALLIRHIGSYLFASLGPERELRDHYIAGVNVGGHAAWQILLQEPMVRAGVIFIGCADFVRLMSKRAAAAKLKSWTSGSPAGSNFLGSQEFPPALLEQVKQYDPAGLLLGQMFPRDSFLYNASRQDWTRRPTADEIAKLIPMMERTLAGKKILNVWGRKDNWVPYSASAPFLAWLSAAIGEGGWFADGALTVQDLAVEDLGHECPSQMYMLGITWLVDAELGPLE